MQSLPLNRLLWAFGASLGLSCGRSDFALAEPLEARSIPRSIHREIANPAGLRPVTDSGQPTAAEASDAAPPHLDDADAKAPSAQTDTVILISVDGLAPRYLEAQLKAQQVPTFARLQRESLFTHNAHTELASTFTIPNHTSMLSGRPIVAPEPNPTTSAHGVYATVDTGGAVHDSTVPPGYLVSVFDEVHDQGGCTGLFTGKNKFMFIARGYQSPLSRADPVPPDDGADKISRLVIEPDTLRLAETFKMALKLSSTECPSGPTFFFFHIQDTDVQGHGYGWGSPEYLTAIETADHAVGEIISEISNNDSLTQSIVILTADHGGAGFGHGVNSDPDVFRIPFYVWTKGGPAGDLYRESSGRTDPKLDGPISSEERRPIRNGDVANLALSFLGLGPIDGSYYQGFEVSMRSDLD